MTRGRKLRALYLAAIVLFSVLAPATAPVAAAGNNSVSGTVTAAGNMAPIGGATVVAESGGTTVDSATAAGDGTYSLDLPTNLYNITYDADGYVANETSTYVSSSKTIDVALERGGTVTGTVTDASDGSPVAGATVEVESETAPKEWTTTTDGSGHYSVDVPGGKHEVIADSAGYAANTSNTVSVTVGGTTTRDVSIQPAGTISGTVKNASGDGLSRARVEVTGDSGNFYSTTTDANGAYTIEVPAGSYEVVADNESYAPKIVDGVGVTVGGTTSRDLTLDDAAVISGTVTDGNGNPVGRGEASVIAYDSSFQVVEFASTDAQGRYEVEVATGTYTVRADPQSPLDATYMKTEETGVSATSGQTTTRDVTLETGATITGTVTDDGGSAVADAEVVVHDDGYQTYRSTRTDGSGAYSVKVPAGTYTVRADKAGYARETVETTVGAGGATTQDLALGQPAVISGTVTDASNNPVTDASVVLEGGGSYYFARVDGSGGYSIDVPAGDYSVTAFNDSAMGAGGHLEGVQPGSTYTADVALKDPTIHYSDVEHVGGTPPNMNKVDVKTDVMGGMMMVQLTDGAGMAGMPQDLSDSNVDDTTEFEITITVEDYDPNSLLWGVRDVNWSTSPNGTIAGATDITIRTKTVNLQGINGNGLPVGPTTDYESVSWPTGQNDKADLGWNNTVYFGVFDMSNVPAEVAGDAENMTISTNAQTFSKPQLTDQGLKVYVAGPHVTTYGAEHDGFYDAFIPDDQLAAWGVDDPSTDLNALYKGDSSNFEVEETDDGAWIRLDISYSDGTVEIAPETGGGSGGGGGDIVSSGGGDGSDDAENTVTTTPVETTVGSATPDVASDTDTSPSTDRGDDGAGTTDDSATVSLRATSTPAAGGTTTAPGGQPGFGLAVALVALTLLAVAGRRRT